MSKEGVLKEKKGFVFSQVCKQNIEMDSYLAYMLIVHENVN
jgi:hypothetical protein